MSVMCYGGFMSLIPHTATLDHPHRELEHIAGAWLASFSSPRTRDSYRHDLKLFLQWLEPLGVHDPLKVGRAHIDTYARHMEEKGYSPTTHARRLATLSSFFGYAVTVGAVANNPAANVRRPKLPTVSPRLGLNLDTAPRVITAGETMSPTHRALIALCLFGGLRVSEAIAAKVGDLREEAGHQVLEVTSKGGRRDLVVLAPAALRLLAPALMGTHKGAHIVRGEEGDSIDRFKAFRMVAAIGRAAGIKSLTPHDLRHGAATCGFESGLDALRIQQHLRHASMATTMRYDHSRDRLDRSAAYGLGVALGGE